MAHCDQCTTEGKCDNCDLRIATLDDKGQCLNCQNGWTLNDKKNECICNKIIN